MSRQKRNRALSLAVLALGFCEIAPAWAAVTPGGDTTVAATSSEDTTVGNTGVGMLNIDGGSSLTNKSGYIALDSGSSGLATVSGAVSKWSNGGDLCIGRSGTGTLTVETGAQVSNRSGYLGYNAGSSGTGTIRGAGSKWTNTLGLHVGYSGSGTLSVEGGAQVSAAFASSLGYNAGSSGLITVRGAGSQWTGADRLNIGYYGNGALHVEAGGQVSSMNCGLGYASKSMGTALVSGAGSKWTVMYALEVGSNFGGSGRLTVTDGGQVSAQSIAASLSDLYGNGTISVRGALLDADLVFDSIHGATQTMTFGTGGALRLTVDGTANLGVGYRGSGSLRIADGVMIASTSGCLGYRSGSDGTATVSGTGSRWANSGNLAVGQSARGTLIIEAGGQVSNDTGSLGSTTNAVGTATISGAGSRWANSGILNVATSGRATLSVDNGGQVSSSTGYVGYVTGSAGVVNVSGAESRWTNSGDLYVGRSGSGTLTVEAGAQVSNNSGYLGDIAGSSGTATVRGARSKWISGTLYVGDAGRGTLTVADGGNVTATMLRINSHSAIRLSVSGNDMLVLGNTAATGSVSNSGTVSLYADTFLPTGVYRPISEYAGRTIAWSGPTPKAFGGMWDTGAQTLTVTELTTLDAGISDTLTTGERLLFTDDLTGQRMGASFGTITGTVSFSAAPMGDADLSELAGVLEEGQEVLSAWGFTTDFSGGEAMLSFDVGVGAEEVAIWRYSNGVWSEFAPSLFTYDSNGLASFTVSSFSGYTVTAAVPEPGTMGLLALGGAMLLARRRARA